MYTVLKTVKSNKVSCVYIGTKLLVKTSLPPAGPVVPASPVPLCRVAAWEAKSNFPPIISPKWRRRIESTWSESMESWEFQGSCPGFLI
jgi:hypothetical protein